VAPVVAAEDPLELLRHPDRDHLGPAVLGGSFQQRAHELGLALVLGEVHDGEVVGLGEAGDRAAEPLTDQAEQRRGGIGLPRCSVRNLTTCPPTCSPGT
jgi:hypothetical protein